MLEEIIEKIEESRLNEEALQSIIFSLNEERGISNDILSAVYDIKEQVEKQIKISKTLPFQHDGISFKKNTFDIDLFGCKLTINWSYYNYITEEVLVKSNIQHEGCSLIKKGYNYYVLNFSVYAISGDIKWNNTLEGLQHELQHFWERLNYGKSYDDINIYNYGMTLLEQNRNKYTISVGFILYLSKKWEQCAYANGVYSYLMNHDNPFNYKENVKETQLYNGLLQLKSAVNTIKNLGGEPYQHPFLRTPLLYLRDNFNISYDKLVEIGEESIRNIIKIIGRTMSKVSDDINKNEDIHHHIDFRNGKKEWNL